MAGESKVTTDHETIRKWAEARDGKPATVKQTEHGDGAGLLRIDFPGYSGKGSLEEITWDEFFAKFDEKHLAFLYQDTTSSGEESRFFKLVSRDTAEHIETEKAQSHKTEEKAHSQKASAHKSDEQAHKTDEKEKAQSPKAAEKSSHKSDEQTHKTHKTDQKEKAQSSKAAEKSSHKTDEQTHKTHKTDEKEKTHK